MNIVIFIVNRFRGGLAFKVHRLLYHSTLGARVIKKKKKRSEAERGQYKSWPGEYVPNQSRGSTPTRLTQRSKSERGQQPSGSYSNLGISWWRDTEWAILDTEWDTEWAILDTEWAILKSWSGEYDPNQSRGSTPSPDGCSSWCRVQGAGFRVQGSGSRVEG